MAFSIDEAAQQANVGRDKIYAAIRAGLLQARKAGRRTLIRRCDLEEYLGNLPALHFDGAAPSGKLKNGSKCHKTGYKQILRASADHEVSGN